MNDFDIAIVGGGLVGASLALALAGGRHSVVLIEAVAPGSDCQPSFDDRTTALGNAGRRILAGIGVWDQVASVAAPIRAIHVSDAGRFGFARLSAAEQGVEALGYVVANRALGAALWERIAAGARVHTRLPAQVQSMEAGPARVTLRISAPGAGTAAGTAGTGAAAGLGAGTGTTARANVGTSANAIAGAGPGIATGTNAGAGTDAEAVLTARLVVAADGATSAVRRDAGIGAAVRDYRQVAIVANVAADTPQAGVAYERFTAAGPLALVPVHDGSYTVVWARPPEDAARCLALDEAGFRAELQRHFGWRAGRFTHAGRRSAYPLQLTRAAATVGGRVVLVGNAAQSLHPVAGQGFNLGLRDAAALAELLYRSDDPGNAGLLQSFAAWRAEDRRGVTGFTDGLVRLFGDRRAPVGAARDLGLLLFDLLPPAKSLLSRVSLGFGERMPRLARDLPL